MFWIQSKISSIVNPNFHRGAQKVSKSFSTYRTLSSIQFPADFTGKEAVAATLEGLEACYYGAEALPRLLSSIGTGMSIQDRRSFADLLRFFKTIQQKFKEPEVEATMLEDQEYWPSAQQILSAGYTRAWGPSWGYGPGGEELAKERGQWLSDRFSDIGAKFSGGCHSTWTFMVGLRTCWRCTETT